MPENFSSATDVRQAGVRVVTIGVAAVIAILLIAGVWLYFSLPDAGAFNARVERLFIENADLTGGAEIKLLEILAQSGTAFSEVLSGYRVLIGVLMLFATGLLIACLVFVVAIVLLNRKMGQIARRGIEVSSLAIGRDEKVVMINDMEFKLTAAAIETLAVLAEARMDGDVLSGAEIEAVVSGRNASDCDEASGATRIKRLRDALGNQMVAELLIKTMPRQGYVLAIEPGAIRVD